MQRICKILADCKARLSGVFSKFERKIKAALKSSGFTAVAGSKKKSEVNDID